MVLHDHTSNNIAELCLVVTEKCVHDECFSFLSGGRDGGGEALTTLATWQRRCRYRDEE